MIAPTNSLKLDELGDRVLPSTTAGIPSASSVLLNGAPTVLRVANAVANNNSTPAVTNAIISTASPTIAFFQSPQYTPPASHVADMVATPTAAQHVTQALAGQAPPPTDTGALTVDQILTTTLNGTTALDGYGPVKVTGTLHSVGFVFVGRATGRITLSNATGSVTLDLEGPDQAGMSPLPTVWAFKVASHTGTFAFPAKGFLNLAVPTRLGYPIQTPISNFILAL